MFKAHFVFGRGWAVEIGQAKQPALFIPADVSPDELAVGILLDDKDLTVDEPNQLFAWQFLNPR